MRNVIQRSNDMNIVFFDIGAHAGQHSLFMSQYISTIHAFEPYPPLVTRFTEMININKIKNIFLHPVGLGDRNESIPFYEPPLRNTGVGSFMNKWYARNEEILINLEIVKGDDLPQEILAKIDLIKLDTEGYEKNIIKGMRNSLHTNRPIVVMELNVGGEQMWKSEGDIYSTYPSNYKILYLEPLDSPSSGKYRLSRFDFDFSLPRNIEKPEDHPNIVLYPSEKETLILSIAL
ncbi:MAG: FkbM family methyltransferase [bacterium]